MTFGYKHVLQRHLARHDVLPSSPAASPKKKGKKKADGTPADAIDLVTGKHYLKHAGNRTIPCPWPHSFDLVLKTTGTTSKDVCPHMFGRAYDLRRHLLAAHGFGVETALVKKWVEERRAAASTPVNDEAEPEGHGDDHHADQDGEDTSA